jgi:hypothetical protein
VPYGGGRPPYYPNYAGLDLSLRKYMYTDTPSGFDLNNARMVTAEDRTFISHLFVGVGNSLFIPPRPNIST